MSLAEFNDYAIATLEAYHDDMADQIHSGSPTYQFMKDAGIVETGPTEGTAFVRPLLARETNEPTWWKYADRVEHVPTDVSEAARFRYFNVRLPIVITAEELKENSGQQKRLDLLGMKVRAAELTMRDRYNKAFIWNRSTYVNQFGGSSTNLPEGIPAIMGQSVGSATAASRNTYGELNRTSATFWRAQTAAYGAAGTLSSGLRTLYLNCSRDGFRPSLLLTNQPGYEALGKLSDTQITRRHDVTGGKAVVNDLGWEGLYYYGAQIRWDPDIIGLHGDGASNHGVIFFLNREFWGLREDDEWNWMFMPFEEPKGNSRQLVHESMIIHRATMWHDNPRLCGILFDMSTGTATT